MGWIRRGMVVVIKDGIEVGKKYGDRAFPKSHEQNKGIAFKVGDMSGGIFIPHFASSQEILHENMCEQANKSHYIQLLEGYIAGYISKEEMDNVMNGRW